MLLPSANVIESAFSPLISLFDSILVFIHKDLVGGSWGLAIVGLTILVRLVLMPLTMRQFRSMQAMSGLSPLVKEIQRKYKEDKQRQSEELMKLYKENGVNPLASCLPLLLQMPVLFSLFYALRLNLKIDICGKQLVKYVNAVHHQHFATAKAVLASSKYSGTTCQQVDPHSAKFLFIPDITNHAAGWVLAVLIVLYVGSQLATSVLISAAADPNQRRLMILMPLIFAVIIIRFPAGVLVYWITTNIWTLGQQYYVRRKAGMLPTRRGRGGESTDDGGPGGGGGAGPAGPAGKGSGTASNGAGTAPGRRRGLPALAGVASGGGGANVSDSPASPARSPSAPGRTPPPPPRKKKKRSGKRR